MQIEKQLIKQDKFDFIYIPIPSFYSALLGRLLFTKTKIKYGIDYIDPWVHFFPGSEKIFSRHWLSTKLAKILEPIAVKNASLITGVAKGYYKPVLDRNPHLKNIVTGAMPYGGEIKDHKIISSLKIEPYLFKKKEGIFQFVYAGAMLPKAYGLLKNIFECISLNKNIFENVEFHFIGTGKITTDENSYNIKPLAEKYLLWNTIVFEYPARIPYLDVLVHLNIADAAFILGSTEPHYTPSKVYQAVLSEKPILAVLHEKSTASDILKKSNAGQVITINEFDLDKLKHSFKVEFLTFKKFASIFKKEQVNQMEFNNFSAKEVTKTLVSLIEKALL